MVTMPDIFLLLGREVERLVTAPYAPSLQDLYSLTQQASPSVISSWASHKPCQVGALVDVLVNSLSCSRFALPLLTGLARAPEFRGALLQQHPHLLDQFLQATIGGSETECLPICLSLLSSPLPPELITPASFAPFVMEMVRKMRDDPCAETVRPLYSISSCLETSGVLFELPQEVMVLFQAELTKTLRNLDDHMGNLLCLATFAKIASPRSTDVEAENEAEIPLWLQNIRHFFGPKRGLKTLDLVVLRTIFACSSNYGNLTAEHATESIRLAIDICDGVDRAQRGCWIEGNSIKVTKLLEKITRDGIDRGVQMLGVSFLVSLVPATSLSTGLMRRSLEWLVSENTVSVLNILPPHTIPRLVRANAARSGQFALTKVLDYVCSALSTSSSRNVDVARLQMARLLLGGLQYSSLVSPIFPSAVADAITMKYGDAIHALVESFPRKPRQLKCDGATACFASASKLENDMLSDLLTFWLEATLPGNLEQEATCSFEMATLKRFLMRGKLMLPESRCIFTETKPLDLRASFSSLKIGEPVNPSRGDWRSGIMEVMMANSHMVNHSIMQKVEDICYELEQRCGNIEAPLRAAEKERSKHCHEAERLEEQKKELENRLQEASDTIAELRQGTACLEGHARSATDRVEELSVNLAQARNELEELRRASQDTLATERESSRTRELDMIASLTERDDRMEELQEESKCQSDENEHLRTTLASVSKDRNASHEIIAALRDEGSTLQTELEKSRTTLAQKDEKIDQLITEKETAVRLAEDLQEKSNEEECERESLRAALHDSAEKYRAELEELQVQSELQCAKMTEEATKRKSEVISLQHAMDETTSNAARELQTKEKRIQHLNKKVQHLREERAAKAREFSEAQQHISRLMGVMGFKPASSDDRAPGKQRSRPPFEPSQVATMQTQTDSEEGIFQSREEDLLAISLESNMSHPGGRSPKRSRHSAFPSAQPSPPRTQVSRKKSKEPSKPHRERKPLEETDHNSQANSQCSEPSPYSYHGRFQEIPSDNQAEQNHFDDIDLDLDLEFSKVFVFTNTSLSEMNGHAHT